MEFVTGSGYTRIVLSRRNLLTLLAKLDGHPANSANTIRRSNSSGYEAYVSAEEDGAHYKDRTPGPMHPETEDALS